MSRRLLNLLTVLSLVLCAASGAAWVFSRHASRQSSRLASFSAAERIWQVELVAGRLIVRSFDDWPGEGTPAQKWRAFEGSGLNIPRADFVMAIPGCAIASGPDFVAVAGAGTYWGRFVTFGLRLWPLPCLAALLPLAWIAAAAVGGRRDKAGICGACGYDLRATPDRCPECGVAAIVSTSP